MSIWGIKFYPMPLSEIKQKCTGPSHKYDAENCPWSTGLGR